MFMNFIKNKNFVALPMMQEKQLLSSQVTKFIACSRQAISVRWNFTSFHVFKIFLLLLKSNMESLD